MTGWLQQGYEKDVRHDARPEQPKAAVSPSCGL